MSSQGRSPGHRRPAERRHGRWPHRRTRMRRPVLGLIFPPAERGLPEEGIAMYVGEQLRFVVTGLGVERMTPDWLRCRAWRAFQAAAKQLAAAGADAIELTGTSLAFYKGEAFNQQLSRDRVEDASGLPATTMSNGVTDALKAVGARRVAAADSLQRCRSTLGFAGVSAGAWPRAGSHHRSRNRGDGRCRAESTQDESDGIGA